jgi:hypothetical protein
VIDLGSVNPVTSSNSAFKRTACLVFVLCCSTMTLFATTVKTDWLSATWTPCEGVGVTGTARYYLETDFTTNDDGSIAVTSIRLHGNSASFDPSSTSLSASVTVVTNGTAGASVNLQRPSGVALEPPSGPNDTRTLYLPDNTTLQVPTGSILRFSVTAVKTNCALNSSSKDIDLTQLSAN